MTTTVRGALATLAMLLAVAPAMASFQAADLIYIGGRADDGQRHEPLEDRPLPHQR
jgi:hypothetical protein